MVNPENIAGYDLGFEEGYCGGNPRFTTAEKDSLYVTSYVQGFYDGQEYRNAVEALIGGEYCEIQRIINQRKIKF